ncbi:uncharacterized protein LOC135137687 isoform X2 [Zophobas morio]|uniref:uncharacterized protein LOC135137687 isoform X2 n=1 Tax=Zophobas morio TaxID=2755281 RepID=UPI0030827B38
MKLVKKWKSVRDYYIKQRKEVDGAGFSKRKKYIYFDMLRFLESSSGLKPISDRSDLPGSSIKPDELSQEDSLELSQEGKEDFIKQEEFEEHDLSEPEPEPELEQLCHSTFTTKRTEIDEDEMFLLSLLPSIRKLDPLQKLNFKLEVMKSLKNVQFPTTN